MASARDIDVMGLIPSWTGRADVSVVASAGSDAGQGGGRAVAVPVAASGPVHPDLGVSREVLHAAGFDGRVGQTFIRPGAAGGPVVLYGIGEPAGADAAVLRDAAAGAALAAGRSALLTVVLPEGTQASPAVAAQAVTEGALLARYRYDALKTGAAKDGAAKDSAADEPRLTALTLSAPPRHLDQAARGAARGEVLARATALARDLANCPPSMMTAEAIAECAVRLAGEGGLEAEVFDRDALERMGCGGLLGVNAGSADPPRMIKLRYTPAAHAADATRLALVGKGIMYDSGGISLKPADAVHATMKNDMSGAGAILSAMAVLRALDCPTAVTGYLMCTDNMPSGSATKLGDVLTIRGGTTVEVLNTDAEGRLVMADALVLAAEDGADAIVDIATLTGACLRALGAEIAGVFGNDEALVEQLRSAAQSTGEPAWQLPLARRYRGELDSQIADIKNMGGPNGGAIHAALFLEEFVGKLPWAHLDIAGPAQNDAAKSWRPKGCTGFGARLLAEFAVAFTPPKGAAAVSSARGPGGGSARGARKAAGDER